MIFVCVSRNGSCNISLNDNFYCTYSDFDLYVMVLETRSGSFQNRFWQFTKQVLAGLYVDLLYLDYLKKVDNKFDFLFLYFIVPFKNMDINDSSKVFDEIWIYLEKKYNCKNINQSDIKKLLPMPLRGKMTF